MDQSMNDHYKIIKHMNGFSQHVCLLYENVVDADHYSIMDEKNMEGIIRKIDNVILKEVI
jgi:hypothetical protein